MRFFRTAALCAAGLAAFAAKANAAVISIADPYFNEFPAGQTAATYLNFKICGTGCAFADNNIVGWSSSVTRAASGDSGQWQTGVPQNTLTFNSDPIIVDPIKQTSTPEPIVVRAINATVSQTVSTKAQAGVKYTLDVDLGFEKTNPDVGFVDLIVGGHQVLATPHASGLTQNQMERTGNWYDFEASYTATSADAGDPIEILLSAMTHGVGFSFFGNVRLTDSLTGPVLDPPGTPEPATWAMLLIGFGGMAGVVAVRRRRNAARQLA